MSVPVARHICRYSLDEVGVRRSCSEDVELALTEACTNVLDHSIAADEEYEVQISVDGKVCSIRVRDTGSGFNVDQLVPSDPSGESGRGIELMRALVDRLDFTSKPEAGVIVHLEKELEFEEDNPVRLRLADTP